jgi:Zn-dependent protease
MHFGPESIAILSVCVLSLVAHEYAHGVVAWMHGDPTARDQGRLTLHPLPHLDLLGSLLVPFALIVTAFPVLFAWARPAPIDHAKLRHPRRDTLRVAVAGPVANLLLAIGFAATVRLLPQGEPWAFARAVLVAGVAWNCALGLFNLIPIPPLDGAWLLAHSLKLRHILALHHFRRVALALTVAFAALPPSRGLFEVSLHGAVGTCFRLFGLSPDGVRH